MRREQRATGQRRPADGKQQQSDMVVTIDIDLRKPKASAWLGISIAHAFIVGMVLFVGVAILLCLQFHFDLLLITVAVLATALILVQNCGVVACVAQNATMTAVWLFGQFSLGAGNVAIGILAMLCGVYMSLNAKEGLAKSCGHFRFGSDPNDDDWHCAAVRKSLMIIVATILLLVGIIQLLSLFPGVRYYDNLKRYIIQRRNYRKLRQGQKNLAEYRAANRRNRAVTFVEHRQLATTPHCAVAHVQPQHAIVVIPEEELSSTSTSSSQEQSDRPGASTVNCTSTCTCTECQSRSCSRDSCDQQTDRSITAGVNGTNSHTYDGVTEEDEQEDTSEY